MSDPIIRLKRTQVPGRVPTLQQIGLGELAINHYDGRVYVRQDTGGVGISTRVVPVGAGASLGKSIFVTKNGDDSNTGLSQADAKLTIKAASLIAEEFDTIKVSAGLYIEDNPITLKKNVSVEGFELRNCLVTPDNVDQDLFWVNDGVHITDLSFVGEKSTNGAAVITFVPLSGVSPDRFFDASRMIRFNTEYIARESVGFLTSGFSGWAGSHREQDAARLIDLNLDFIAAEAVGYLTSTDYKNPPFNIGITSINNCKEDVISILGAVSYDLKASGNERSVGAGLSYYVGAALTHITGVTTDGYSIAEATIDTFIRAAGIATYIINNYAWGSVEGSSVAVTTATYDNLSGITTITAVGHGVTVGSVVRLSNLQFSCPGGSGITTDLFPDYTRGDTFKVTQYVGINTFVVNVGASTIPHSYVGGGNIFPRTNYQSTETQVFDDSVIRVKNGCVGVGTRIDNLVGIVTSIIGIGTTAAPEVQKGVMLDTEKCISDIQKVWKAVCYDITRGGNSKCVGAGLSYFDSNGEPIDIILKNTNEFQQTIDTLDYSFNVARSVVNNCTWGGYPNGNPINISSIQYDKTIGLTTITAVGHGLTAKDPVKIQGLEFACPEGSPSPLINVTSAIYDNISGLTTITTPAVSLSLFNQGDRVRLENLVFECDSGGGPATALYPSGNFGYEFTIVDKNEGSFVVNVGPSTLPHTYVSGGKVRRLYTPVFSVSTAVYDRHTGITTITAVGIGSTTAIGIYVEPGDKVKLENLVFECNSGGGPSTALYPSGNNGYVFTVISTADGRYVDAANLIDANKLEIIDKSLGAIALAHSDFYFPGDSQTTSYSRFKDGYRLIQYNKQEIIDRSLASVAIGFSDFYFPGDNQTNDRSRYFDSYRLIQNNKSVIVGAAWSATASVYPSIISTETKCKRDLGYFVDAISLDVFAGGNNYARQFTLQYFDANGAPLNNGLVGEIVESNYAFVQTRELMKQAITNTLVGAAYSDLTITADPVTGSNTDPNSCANVRSNIDNLVGIVTTTLGLGNTSSLPSENLGYFSQSGIGTTSSPGGFKCARDLGYFVDAVSTDVFTSGNNYVIQFTKQYFNNSGVPISNGLVGETAESVYAFNSARDVMKLAITNQLYRKDTTVSAGSSYYNDGTSTIPNTSISACADVQSNIDNLVSIATQAITAGNLNTLNNIVVNIGEFSSGESKCRRDIAYVVEAISDDVRNGTNKNIRAATRAYFDANGDPISNGLVGETSQSVTAFNAIATYAKKAITNQLNNKDLTIAPDTNPGIGTTSNVNPYSCANVQTNIDNLISIITTTITNGNLTAYPQLYVSNKFRVNVGPSTLPHTYVSGGTVTSGITTTVFPDGTWGPVFPVKSVVGPNTFTVVLGGTIIDHTYISGGTVQKYQNFSNKATQIKDLAIQPDAATGYNDVINSCANVLSAMRSCVGVVTTILEKGPYGPYGALKSDVNPYGIKITYPGNFGVGSDIPNDPSFSPGVGNVLKGPYIRNCTNFIPDSIGMKVDGFDAEPGDQDDQGITGMMSVDSYTQYNQNGIGVTITNGAYAQLVSIFTICTDESIVTENGGQCDITNSNSSFGRLGLVSRRVSDNTTKSIYRTTAELIQPAIFGDLQLVVSGVGSQRPYDGQALYIDELYYAVESIRVTDGGSGYTTVPNIVIDAPSGPSGIRAQALAVLDNGSISEILIVNTGTQYEATPLVTIDPPSTPGGITATADVSSIAPIYYKVGSATLPHAGISTIRLVTGLNAPATTGQTVYLQRQSLQIVSSHSFEYIGAGNFIPQARPSLGGVVIQENEVIMENGGIVVYTSTDQAGNFRIGDGVVIDQATGTISGRFYVKSLFNSVTPFILALGG
jgi:hypothetical protein